MLLLPLREEEMTVFSDLPGLFFPPWSPDLYIVELRVEKKAC